MLSLLRALHVVSIALWFGSVAFFTVAGVLIFQAFDEASRTPAERGLDRWLPEPPAFASRADSPVEGMPTVPQERGSRLAGIAVSRIFPVYYGLQVGCGVVALLTAVLLARSGAGGLHGLRTLLTTLALGSVLVGWWLEHEVSQLRVPRNEKTDQVLAQAQPDADLVATARSARAAFGRWHGYSLIQNFATLGLSLALTLLIPAAVRQGD